MSCVEPHLDESGVKKGRSHCGPMRRDQIALHHRISRIGLALLCLLIASGEARQSAAQEIDFTLYARAADHCRGDVATLIALAQDRRVLCLDGAITSDLNVAVAADLADHGIAVVRSRGGEPARAVQLANTLRDRNAAIVVRDFCLYACASFILLASSEAYVDGALVAWGLFQRYLDQDCIGFVEGKDGAGPFLTWLRCSPDHADERPRSQLWNEFYRDRIVDTVYTDPPESRFVRRELMNLYRSTTGQYPLVLWTWNPRHHASAIKTKLVYQHYPESQEEVDAIAGRLGLKRRVICDP